MRNAPDLPVEPAGLPADDVDRHFSRLIPFSRVALAVSGGADSLCLMVLFSEWKRRVAWPGNAEVIVVDHGLRAESADEAKFVVENAAKAGLPAKILKWTGNKPTSNVQDAARKARYQLISQRMSETGAEVLLLGHHRDDQAETFLDRLTRGSGLYGLSSMSADEADGPEGLRLVRPFLEVSKNRLEASLRDRGMNWCNDPSNRNSKYKRSRLRRILSLLEEEGLTAERVADTAGQLRRAREALETTIHSFAAHNLEEHPAGPARMARRDYRTLPEELRLRLLSLVLGRVTGLRPRIRLQKLQSVDDALMSEDILRHTLAGTRIKAEAKTVWFWREPGRMPPEILQDLEGEGIWDHRFIYFAPKHQREQSKAVGLRLGPLCEAPIRAKDIEWPQDWPKEAFACAPVLWTENGNVVSPSCCLGLRIGENDKEEVLNLARLPFRAKLDGNYLDGRDAEQEI
ncbi:MAG: tRNA lysidine(34) synthetase TilS [Roseibium sp.]|nr:tRNA lysidine(34) synthetase TilS [Roseibium sp.]